MTTASGEKLRDLNQTLIGVENALLRRKVDAQDATIDGAMDIINTAAENGQIELDDCEGCDDEDSGDGTEDGDGSGDESGDDKGDKKE